MKVLHCLSKKKKKVFPMVFDIFNYLLGIWILHAQCLISSNLFLNKQIYFCSYRIPCHAWT